MKVQTKILLMTWAVISTSLISCQKTTEQPSLATDEENAPQSDYIPLQIGSGKSKMTFSYISNRALSKISYGDGTSIEMEYNKNGVPAILKHYEGTKLKGFVTYSADGDGRVIKAEQYESIGKNDNNIGYYQLSYDGTGAVGTISYFDTNQRLKYRLLLEYDEHGNLSRERNSTNPIISEYAYDDRKGLLSQVDFVWLFALEDSNIFLRSRQNNLKSGKNTEGGNDQLTYTYNKDRYPLQVTTATSGNTQTVQVSYQKVE